MSLILKASMPLEDSFSLYGMIAYTKTELDASVSGFNIGNQFQSGYSFSAKDSISDSGLGLGVGISYRLTNNTNTFVEYHVRSDFENSGVKADFDTVTLGLSYRF